MVFKKGFTKARWDRAREMKKLDEQRTGTSEGLREYYKNDNPFTKKVFEYEVTFELKYSGNNYDFFIPQESFTVRGYGDLNGEEEIREKVKQGVANNFKGKSTGWIYDNTEVNIRGVEESKVKYKNIDLNELNNNNVYATNIPNIEVNKNKNKNKYPLNIWL